MKIEELQKLLTKSYRKEMCYPKIKKRWSKDNPSFGMCAITSLIVNDYFGGEIAKMYVGEISHYFNLLDSKIIDLTSSQFKKQVNYTNYTIVSREEILNNKDTLKRYHLLKKFLKMNQI